LTNPKEKIHLFDLEQDPLEKTNIAATNLKIVAKLEYQLCELRNTLKQRFDKGIMSDEETKKVEEELKKLGYV
jgi:hypothetical protein